MKLLSTILAVIVIVLNTFACTDADDCSVSHCADMSLVPVNHKDLQSSNNHQEHEDTCSPFCQCACCSVTCIVLEISFKPNTMIEVAEGTKKQTFIPNKIRQISLPIWQPPQLC